MIRAIAFTVAALSLGTAAIAAEPSPVKARALVKSSDGGRIGFIDRVTKDAAGQPTMVQIIYKGRFVEIPANTLSSAEKGLVTSMTTAEVNKL